MVQPLRTWLSKHPHPLVIAATYQDESKKRVRIGVSRSKFRDAEEALAGAVSCDALDAQDNVLRTWFAEEDGEVKARQSAPDVESLRDIALAKLLAETADRAVLRHKEFVQMAFDQNTELLKLVAGRLDSLETAWHQRIMAEAEAVQAEREIVAAEAEAANDPNAGLVAQTIAGALAQMGGPPPPPNGKG